MPIHSERLLVSGQPRARLQNSVGPSLSIYVVPVSTFGRASRRPPDYSDLSAPLSSAKESIATVRLEPRNQSILRHFKAFQDLSRSRIDSPDLALVPFGGGVPELPLDPRDPSHKAVGLYSTKDCPSLGIDLMDLPIAILPDPQRSFGPREPRVTAAAGRRDSGKHTAVLRIDFLDAILCDLKKVLAVKCCSGVSSDIDRAYWLAAGRVECIQFISGRKPNVLTIIGDSVHAVGAGKWSIFAYDFGCCSFHMSTLINWQRRRE